MASLVDTLPKAWGGGVSGYGQSPFPAPLMNFHCSFEENLFGVVGGWVCQNPGKAITVLLPAVSPTNSLTMGALRGGKKSRPFACLDFLPQSLAHRPVAQLLYLLSLAHAEQPERRSLGMWKIWVACARGRRGSFQPPEGEGAGVRKRGPSRHASPNTTPRLPFKPARKKCFHKNSPRDA